MSSNEESDDSFISELPNGPTTSNMTYTKRSKKNAQKGKNPYSTDLEMF